MAIGVAHAQGYPTKPVRMITPFPAGPADVLGRFVGDRLGKSLGQPFVMESRPGAAGKGSPGHVLGELFMLKTGTRLVHVPYKGNGPAVQSVVAGETALMRCRTAVACSPISRGRRHT